MATDRDRRMSRRPRALVCDHEPLGALALRRVLRDAGFAVDVTSTAADALNRVTLRVPDALIIELRLPDGDGADVCRRVREWSEMPLIVLSAVDAEDEKVRALEAGADHYVVKPFAPRELVARLCAVLRRAERHDTAPRFMVDGLQIDLAARALRREHEEIHLTPIEFKLLRVLLRHRGRPLTHPVLLEQVWGSAHVEDRQTLRTHIANLRRKIEIEGVPAVIRTEHGVGYRFAEAPPARARSAEPGERGRLVGDGRRAA